MTERATGGRVEIGSFNYNWRDLTAEVQPFVLRGTEPASAPPLFRAKKIKIGLRIISVLEKKVDIASLILDSPSVNLTIDPDGSTNIPRPKVPRFDQNVVEDLIDLRVQHIEIHDGTLNYNSWRVPMDSSGENLEMSLVYQPAAGPRYLCYFVRPHANLLTQVARSGGVRLRLPGGARQEHHSSVAHEPEVRRNENREQGKHHQSLLPA